MTLISRMSSGLIVNTSSFTINNLDVMKRRKMPSLSLFFNLLKQSFVQFLLLLLQNLQKKF